MRRFSLFASMQGRPSARLWGSLLLLGLGMTPAHATSPPVAQEVLDEVLEHLIAPQPSLPPPFAGPALPVVEPVPQPSQVVTSEEEPSNLSEPARSDVWERIRRQRMISVPLTQPAVQREIAWFSKHQKYLHRTLERAAPYLHYVIEELHQRDLPLELALLPIIESAYQPRAVSPSRAAGIWQFVPSTGLIYGLQQNWWYDGRRDIVASTRAALDYLQKLNTMFQGDWSLALAAYNAGEGTVSRAVKKNVAAGKAGDFWSLKLSAEPSSYVPRFLALVEVVAHPERYGLTLYTVPDAPYLVRVDMPYQVDLLQAAQLADLPFEQMLQFNPGFKRWVGDPAGPHHLLLPVEKEAIFKERLAALAPEQRVQWVRHTTQRAESVHSVAELYNTSVDVIKRFNRVTSDMFKRGMNILVPRGLASSDSYAARMNQSVAALLPQDITTTESAAVVSRSSSKAHVIARGDTLWSVALKYRVPPDELARLNRLSTHTRLMPGRRLNIPGVSAPQSATRLVAKASPLKKLVYRVKQGDTLHDIAQRFDVSVRQLVQWNALTSKRSLPVGRALKVYINS